MLQLAKYQEQPQLLDAYLESIVQPLALLMRSAALADPAQRDLGRVQDVARLLHVLVVVRGHKTVVRFFPHEAADLERVLQVSGSGCVRVTTGVWVTVYRRRVWLPSQEGRTT